MVETIQSWANACDIRLEYIEPGEPLQNTYVERLNRTLSYEWLPQHHLADLQEVQTFAIKWKYKHDRPIMALGGITPKAATDHVCITVLLLASFRNEGIAAATNADDDPNALGLLDTAVVINRNRILEENELPYPYEQTDLQQREYG